MALRNEIRRPAVTILLLLLCILLYDLRQLTWKDAYLATVLIEFPYYATLWAMPVWCGAAFVSIYDYAVEIRYGESVLSAAAVILYAAMGAIYLFWLFRVNEGVILILTLFSALLLLIRRAVVR